MPENILLLISPNKIFADISFFFSFFFFFFLIYTRQKKFCTLGSFCELYLNLEWMHLMLYIVV